jgi:raffinose/stachyose/melibiose transport system permease protein
MSTVSGVRARKVTSMRFWRNRRPMFHLLVLVAGILLAFPFVFMVSASFKSAGEFLDNPFLLPRNATMANYQGLIDSQFRVYFLNSVIIAVVCVAATVFAAAMAAYPLSLIPFRYSSVILLLFLFGLMVPIHVTLIPLYALTQQLGLYDSLAGLFGPFIAFSLPIAIYVLVGFFKQVPGSIIDAARVDGAGHGTIFFRIVLPMAAPALWTVAIITFLFVWNDFIFPLILLSSPEGFPIPLGLRDFAAQFRINVPGVMAALTVASLPVILFFLVAQEKVVTGLAAGAVQGE